MRLWTGRGLNRPRLYPNAMLYLHYSVWAITFLGLSLWAPTNKWSWPKILLGPTATFSQKILVGRLLQVLNLNPPLKLLSYPLVIVSNNLPHKICCENVVDITFLLLYWNVNFKNLTIGLNILIISTILAKF